MDEAAEAGDTVYVPSVSIVELVYLIEKGKLPEDALDRLVAALALPDGPFQLFPLDLDVALKVREVPRDAVPDMPDRIIAATGLHLRVPVVSCDARIRASGIDTIW
jgi:PIN domain nuclease of toxin-antitoxin system